MKKFFNLFAVAAGLTLMVSACSKALAPAEPSTAPLTAGTIEIAISNVTDYSFDVTITPKGTASYYSYLVDNDEPYEGIDASQLYAVKYSSIAQGTVKYGKGTESYTFSVEADPNTQYTVYAVAGATDGNVGEVVYKTFTTSDELDPSLEDFQFQEKQVTLIFSEDVQYVEGKKITATAYPKLALTGEPLVASAEGEIAQNKDGVVIVKFPDFELPGTYYAVSYPEGTFIDLVGNPVAALETSFLAELKVDEEGEFLDPKVNEGGVYGYLENVPFALDTKDVPESIAEYTDLVKVTSEYPLVGVDPSQVSASFASASGKTTSFSGLSEETCVLVDKQTLAFSLPEEPARGDFISYTVGEGTVMDIFGNVNAECELGPMVYSYGYTLEDVLGTYTFNTTSVYAAYGYGPYSETVTIAESDDPEKGNIMFTGVLGESPDPVKFYGSFDPDGGTITIAGGQVVLVWNQPLLNADQTDYLRDDEGNIITEVRFMVLYLADGSGYYYTDDLGFDMPSPHTLTFWYDDACLGFLWGRAATGALASWWDQLFFTSIEYTPDSAEPEVPVEPGSFKGYRQGIPSVFELSAKSLK